MTLSESWAVFQKVANRDQRFTHLGLPRGWYLRFHYWGRLCDRLHLTFPIEIVTAHIFEKSVSFPLSAPYGCIAEGVFVDRQYQISDQLNDRPHTILDLGANIGLGTLYLQCQFPEAAIACVEPDPRNLPLLRQTLDLNQISATVIEAAISATSGQLDLICDHQPGYSHFKDLPTHLPINTVSVNVRTIPDVLSELGWTHIDLLKIDIEGAEEELLSKNNDWLTQVGAIILEIHNNTTPEAIASYLKPYGFQITKQPIDSEPIYLAQRVKSAIYQTAS